MKKLPVAIMNPKPARNNTRKRERTALFKHSAP